MKYYSFEVVIESEPEDGGYSAYSPSLPGCFSNGATLEEAKHNIREVISQHVETLLAHDQPVPPAPPHPPDRSDQSDLSDASDAPTPSMPSTASTAARAPASLPPPAPPAQLAPARTACYADFIWRVRRDPGAA